MKISNNLFYRSVAFPVSGLWPLNIVEVVENIAELVIMVESLPHTKEPEFAVLLETLIHNYDFLLSLSL